MKRHQVALECVEISVKVKKSLKPVKRSTLIIDMKKCLIMVDSWVLKIKDIKEGGLLQEPRNTLTLKGNGKVIVCIVADTDDEIDMLDDFVDNKIVPSIQLSKSKEKAKDDGYGYGEEMSPPAAKFGRQKVAKGYGQKRSAFNKTLANVERDASAAFVHAAKNQPNDSPSSSSSSSIEDPALFSPNDKSLKAIQYRERMRAKQRERDERSKNKRKAITAPPSTDAALPPVSSAETSTKKKLKLSSPAATTPLNTKIINSVLNDPIEYSDDEEDASVSSSGSAPRRLNFDSTKKRKGSKKNVRFIESDEEVEESEEVKKAKLEAKSQVALHAMLAPAAPSPAVNQRSKLMELARLKKVGQQRPSPPVRKAPTNPYAKSSSKSFVKSTGSSLFKTTAVRTGGLTNIGNSCYMNAVIQCLLSIPSFVKEMKSDKLKAILVENASKGGAKFPLHDAFLKLAETRSGKGGDAKMLKDVMDKLGDRFRGNAQQDAHEFLNDVIDFLADEFDQKEEGKGAATGTANEPVSVDDSSPTMPTPSANSLLSPPVTNATPTAPPPAPASTTFSSGNASVTSASTTPSITPSNASKQSTSQTPFLFPTDTCFEASVDVKLCCKSCGWARSKVEYYRHFSIDVESNVDTALETFFKTEVLNIDCEKCPCNEATQTKRINKAPGALLLHLKRFVAEDAEDGRWKYKKVEDQVSFGETASLTKFMAGVDKGQQADFKLKSVVRHIGTDAGSGHYVTDAVNSEGKWTTYNDSVASSVTASNVLGDEGKKGAYIICYEAA